MINRIALLTILGALCVFESPGQDCRQNLDESRRSYYNGQFDRVIELLDNCVGNFESISEKSDALELLTKASLMLDNTEQARRYVELLLTVDPLFTANQSDIISFISLLKEYEIRNRFNIGIEVGLNYANYTVMQYQSYAGISTEPESYNSKVGTNLGILFDYALTKNVYARTKLLFNHQGYSQTETQLDYLKVTVNERRSYFAVPVMLSYQLNAPKIRPFISAGMSFHYLVASNASLDLVGIDQDFPVLISPNSYSTSDYDLSGQRKTLTSSYVFGAGINKPVGLWSVQVEFNYEFGLNNLVKTEARYSDANLLAKYSYVPDDFKMDQFRFSVGIVRSFVYPKRIVR